MSDPAQTVSLWDYRRSVEELYAAVRSAGGGEDAWQAWRASRDGLFAQHPQSALSTQERRDFEGLHYFVYDPSWRFEVEVEPDGSDRVAIANSSRGVTAFTRFGTVTIRHGDSEGTLSLFWLEGYAGGVFLPFRDATNGAETYGGGRYLLDSAKGADLGSRDGRVILDFNYAYHPSCVYDEFWSCPLAPPDNRLEFAVRAGERLSAGSPT